MQKDWEWRREAHRLGGSVFGWLELEQQMSARSVPRSVHTLSSAKLDVPNSKGSIKPGCLSVHLNILVELVSVCLNSTSRASMTVLRLVLWTNQLISMELESVKYKPKYQVEEHHLLTSWDHNVYNVVLQFIFNFVLIIVYVFSGCCKSGFQIYHRI